MMMRNLCEINVNRLDGEQVLREIEDEVLNLPTCLLSTENTASYATDSKRALKKSQWGELELRRGLGVAGGGLGLERKEEEKRSIYVSNLPPEITSTDFGEFVTLTLTIMD